jgi:UDP-galactopyranose mutase
MEDILIVGAGLSGATIANKIAHDFPDRNITIIEKRNHIGGNVYDYIDDETGIRVSKYGAHLFHTNDTDVWNYVQQFGKWIRWDHKVLAKLDDATYVPVPVNPITINTIANTSISNEVEMMEWLKENTIENANPANSEEVALNRVGPVLYEMLFKEYTIKQWNKDPKELDPSIMARIPIQTSFDTRYFTDKYQALPEKGYTEIIKNMLNLENITIKLNTNWEECMKNKYKIIIFTGPIDTYFKNILPPLEYRSIDFIREVHDCKGYYQPNSVINYPGSNTPYTRTVEYKHFLHQQSNKTILFHEKTTDNGEPYYPIMNQKNKDLYEKYKSLTVYEPNVHFLGRLANYKYFNMDQAIKNALEYYEMIIKVQMEHLKY